MRLYRLHRPRDLKFERLDLRTGCRFEEQIRDIAQNGLVRILVHLAQTLPIGILSEFPPVGLQLILALERQHVRQIRHLATDQRLAKEDRMQSDAAEDCDLAGIVEHLNLLLASNHAGTLVDPQLEDSLLSRDRRLNMRHSLEGDHQRAFHSRVSRFLSGRRQKSLAPAEEIGVLTQTLHQCCSRFQRLVRKQHIYGAQLFQRMKYTDRLDSGSIQRRNCRLSRKRLETITLLLSCHVIRPQFQVVTVTCRLVVSVGDRQG